MKYSRLKEACYAAFTLGYPKHNFAITVII